MATIFDDDKETFGSKDSNRDSTHKAITKREDAGYFSDERLGAYDAETFPRTKKENNASSHRQVRIETEFIKRALNYQEEYSRFTKGEEVSLLHGERKAQMEAEDNILFEKARGLRRMYFRKQSLSSGGFSEYASTDIRR